MTGEVETLGLDEFANLRITVRVAGGRTHMYESTEFFTINEAIKHFENLLGSQRGSLTVVGDPPHSCIMVSIRHIVDVVITEADPAREKEKALLRENAQQQKEIRRNMANLPVIRPR